MTPNDVQVEAAFKIIWPATEWNEGEHACRKIVSAALTAALATSADAGEVVAPAIWTAEQVEAIHGVYLMRVREYDTDFRRYTPPGFWEKKYGTNLHSTELGERWALREALNLTVSPALPPPEQALAERVERLDQPTVSAWPFNGYAPGDYMCKCHSCGAQFQGDKRSPTCLSCAVLLSKNGYRQAPKGWKWEMVPDYPTGVVIGACICGSWPGGECLKCPPLKAPSVTGDTK